MADQSNYQPPRAEDDSTITGNDAGTRVGEAPPPPPANEPINLTFRDASGQEVQFKLKRTTKLGKAMGAFSARVERHESTLRFLTNGERIAPDDTCEKWELEDGDIIEVFNEQIGGGDEMQVEGEAKEEGDTKGWAMATDFANDLNACIEKLDEDEATAKQYINFSVEDDEMIIDCKIRPTTRMISLIKAFAKYHGLVANNVIISFRGIYLDGTETTGSMGMVNGDVLHAEYR